MVSAAESFVMKVMKGRDASHDFAHAIRVRNLALSMAREEALGDESLKVIELAALLHDVDDHKYANESHEQNRVEKFLDCQGTDPSTTDKVLSIIKRMGFKDNLGKERQEMSPELAVVQDADRLDAIGAIGIARCFAFGGSRNHILHDPSIPPVLNGLTKEEYTRKDRQHTMINHFYEKLLTLQGLMNTEAGRKRAEKRHKFMEAYLSEFLQEWDGCA